MFVNFANPLNFLATQNAGGNLGHAVSQLCVCVCVRIIQVPSLGFLITQNEPTR